MLSLILGHGVASPRILCLGAHCDDIEIGCGGTILQLLRQMNNCEILWTIFSSNPQRAGEAKRSADRFLARAAKRQVVVQDFRDGFLQYAGAEVKACFEAIKKEFMPDIILTHHREDLHQDHRLISELTWNTFRDHLIFEYEIPKYDGDFGRPNVFVPLAEDACTEKIAIIMDAYESQKIRPWFEPETFRSLMRLRGLESNSPSRYAEAFFARKVKIVF